MSKIIEVYSKGERYEVVIDDDVVLPGKISKINNYFCINVNVNLGTYNTKEDARIAYKIEHVKSFGEYSPYYKEKLPSNPPKKSQMVKAGKGYVFRSTSNKYESKIGIRGKRIHLGSFDTPEEAQRAYRKAHAEAFGEFSPYYKYDQGNTEEENK